MTTLTAWQRERLFSRLIIDRDTGCLLWPATLSAPNDYGRVRWNGRHLLVHRLMYELFVGPVPEGLQLDHLCRTRRCAAPAHLEAVSIEENLRRQGAAITHCPAGHEYTAANTYIWRGARDCRACNRNRQRQYRALRVAS